ncbi:heavy-metal-associated domain-containing protein [Massilia sp. H-1]|nr:heavy-metal-associated domain-containing protein [Massilia sp. H-1]
MRSVTVRMNDDEVLVQTTTPAPLLEMVRSIESAGYKVTTFETTLQIEGMVCIGCASPVERALAALPGVVQVMASYSARSAQVLSLSPMARPTLAQAIEHALFAVADRGLTGINGSAALGR